MAEERAVVKVVEGEEVKAAIASALPPDTE